MFSTRSIFTIIFFARCVKLAAQDVDVGATGCYDLLISERTYDLYGIGGFISLKLHEPGLELVFSGSHMKGRVEYEAEGYFKTHSKTNFAVGLLKGLTHETKISVQIGPEVGLTFLNTSVGGLVSSWISGTESNGLDLGLHLRLGWIWSTNWRVVGDVIPRYLVVLRENRTEGFQPLYSGNVVSLGCRIGIAYSLPSKPQAQ